ncbi:MAG: DUF4175 family protein [Candidatus Kapaibacterium sp.]
MNNYQQLHSELINKLAATRRKELLQNLLVGVMNTASTSLLTMLLLAGIESFAHGDTTFRTILACVWLAITAGAFLFFSGESLAQVVSLKQVPSIDTMALRVGNVYSDLRDTLCNALQLAPLADANSAYGVSSSLALATFETVASRARTKDFDVVISRKELKRSMVFFLSSLAITAGILGFVTPVNSALNRIVHYNESFLPLAPFTLSIEPKTSAKLRGEKVRISVRATGIAPETVTLLVKEEQQENYDSYTLRQDSMGVYHYEIPTIKRSIEFYAESPWVGGAVTTEHGTVTVTDRPIIRSLSGRVTSPAYSRLAARELNEQSADVTALRGSQVELQVLANKDITSAEIYIVQQKNSFASASDTTVQQDKQTADTTKITLKTEGRKAAGSFSVRASGEYYIVMQDQNKQQNAEPIHYKIVALTDGAPTIALLEPTADAQVSEQAQLPMKIAITDDYGFSHLKLYYKLSESRYAAPSKNFTAINIPISQSEIAQEIPYLWNLNAINISPGDRYEFYCEITDNDQITGPKSAKTSILTVRLPSLDEVLTQADEMQENIAKDLEKIAKQAEEVRKDAEEVNRELRKNQEKPMDWENKKKIEDLLKKQAETQKKLDQVQQNLEKVADNLKENNAISPETLQKYQELQKLMKEVNSPELRKQMEQMQKMMQQMNQEQLQQAMKNFQFNEEQFKKSIERTMNLLKRMKAEQMTDALTKRAEELAKKQDEIKKQSENTNPNDKQKRNELAEQQKNAKEDMKKLSDELKDLEKLMKDIGKDMPMNEMDKAKDELSEKETSDEMQEAQEQMEKGEMSKAQDKQKKASDKLKKFAQQMKKMKQEMKKNLAKETVKQMQKAVSDMLDLSQKQEKQRQKSQSMDANSTQFPQNAQEQEKMEEQLASIANRMMQLSQKTTQVTPEMAKNMGDAMKNMEMATKQLSDRNPQQAGIMQGQAMSSMNKAAMQMQDALNKMQGEGDGSCENPGGKGEGGDGDAKGSMMQKLQEMAGKQQGINQGTQQLGTGQQLSPEKQAEMGRLASEQGKAQRAMEELAKKNQGRDGKKNALGNLDKIAQEMKEIVADMNSGMITPETLKRQERILSRLLDATRSMNERDYETKRESRAGQDVTRNSPNALDYSTQEGKTRALQDLLRSIQQGYTKDYEALIRKYFETVQKAN